MQPVDVHEETVLFGTTKHRMEWLLRQMHKGLPGMDDYEYHHNLIFHFFGITDPAFPDRVRIAWKSSGLSTKIPVEVLPPIEIEGEAGSFKTGSWDVILENVDPCFADAIKKSFVNAMINAHRIEAPPTVEEEPEQEPEGTRFDPHSVGLQDVGEEKKEDPPVEENPYSDENNPFSMDNNPYATNDDDDDEKEGEDEKPKIEYPIEEVAEEKPKAPDEDDEDSEEALEAKEDPYSDDNYDPHAIGLQSKKKPGEQDDNDGKGSPSKA